MASCELDYRLSNSSESMDTMDYDETDSDDDNKLQIVENGSLVDPVTMPRTLFRSLSAVETMRDDFSMGGGGNASSDAVESLLLLGQRPVLAAQQDDKEVRVNGNQRIRGGYKYSNNVEQRMMVNYYQRMRERNNEASKRCRLKRRIKQDSLEKTRLLLESQQDVLKKRLDKLHKIKEILNNACRATGKEGCECVKFCNMIKCAQKEMPDNNEYSNMQLIRKSRFIRETNLEEIIGAQGPDPNDLRPLKRGPRKVDNDFTIDADSLLMSPDSPAPLSSSSSSSNGALDLSANSKTVQNINSKSVNLIKVENPSHVEGGPNRNSKVKPAPVTYVTLAPKTSAVPPPRTVIVDNPNTGNNGLPSNMIPIVTNNSSSIFPAVNGGDKLKQKSTISLNNLSGTTTIFVTPLGGNGPPTILNLPIHPNTQVLAQAKSPTEHPHFIPVSSKPPPIDLLINKAEPEVVIKSEPDFEDTQPIGETETIVDDPSCITSDETIVKTEEEDIGMDIVDTKLEKDPTMSCAAILMDKEDPLTCSSDLVDLNSLTQHLDLVTMEPRTSGELISAEKYIIKSRLEMAFWKAEESASFICTNHRNKIIKDNNLQSCSVCGKKRSKKLEMYIITYRMSVEFYMTNGQFLSIGQLACTNCKGKSLKGLDFSNSYILPEVGHPLHQVPTFATSSSTIADRDDVVSSNSLRKQLLPKEILLSKDIMPSSNTSPVKPFKPLSVLPPTKVTEVLSIAASQTSPTTGQNQARPDSTRAKQELNDALMALNPEYNPLGFTINSLSSCSEGVLKDTVAATKAAMSTILATIAPGQEAALWTLMKPEMEKLYNDQSCDSEQRLPTK